MAGVAVANAGIGRISQLYELQQEPGCPHKKDIT